MPRRRAVHLPDDGPSPADEKPKYVAVKTSIDLDDIKTLLARAANQVEIKISDGTELTKQDVEKIDRILDVWVKLEQIEDKFDESARHAEKPAPTPDEQAEIDRLTGMLSGA